jgi:hypothetical protein
VGTSAAASSEAPPLTRRAANAACGALLAVEVIGSVAMWVLIPLAWMWVGGRVFAATGSLAADGAVAFLGFVGTTILMVGALIRIDRVWVALRRRAGHDQDEGALTRTVVVSSTLGILLFVLWYYVLSDAYVLPFMGAQR